MTAPLFTGDTNPLKFTITDADGAVNPSAVEVFLLKPNNEYLEDIGEAAVDGNEISINVSGTYNDRKGHYKAYFVCTLSYGERTHVIEYDVRINPERNR